MAFPQRARGRFQGRTDQPPPSQRVFLLVESTPKGALRVIALSAYPIEAAGERFRVLGMRGPLLQRDIRLEAITLLDSQTYRQFYVRAKAFTTVIKTLKCAIQLVRRVRSAGRADVILVRREAMMFGPPLLERWAQRLSHCPLVLDLDDATYVTYTSPTFGPLTRLLKWPGKTDALIRWSTLVFCGSPTVLQHVEEMGGRGVLLPTVVDLDEFKPRTSKSSSSTPPVVGWIGSHSTFQYLEAILPAFEALGRRFNFRLRIVGAGVDAINLEGVDVDLREWELDREIADFQGIDIGLYPVTEDRWSRGKSGFKAVQYMAVGVPFVASPVGVLANMGEPGVTHLEATSVSEWEEALAMLLDDPGRRARMGHAGRNYALQNFDQGEIADRMAQALRSVVLLS
jgi:glycosyltransferase involved in cell wall biosynthesis